MTCWTAPRGRACDRRAQALEECAAARGIDRRRGGAGRPHATPAPPGGAAESNRVPARRPANERGRVAGQPARRARTTAPRRASRRAGARAREPRDARYGAVRSRQTARLLRPGARASAARERPTTGRTARRPATRSRRRARPPRAPRRGHGAAGAARAAEPHPGAAVRPAPAEQTPTQPAPTQSRRERWASALPRGARADAAAPCHPLARCSSARNPAQAGKTRTRGPRKRRRPNPGRPCGRPARPAKRWCRGPATRGASADVLTARGHGCLALNGRARGGTRARGGLSLGLGGTGGLLAQLVAEVTDR